MEKQMVNTRNPKDWEMIGGGHGSQRGRRMTKLMGGTHGYHPILIKGYGW